MLLKSRAFLTCFRACFLPGRAKDLSAPRYIYIYIYIYRERERDFKIMTRLKGRVVRLRLLLLYVCPSVRKSIAVGEEFPAIDYGRFVETFRQFLVSIKI